MARAAALNARFVYSIFMEIKLDFLQSANRAWRLEITSKKDGKYALISPLQSFTHTHGALRKNEFCKLYCI
jgi:hypothetical protein